jgi:hypothetical protein
VRIPIALRAKNVMKGAIELLDVWIAGTCRDEFNADWWFVCPALLQAAADSTFLLECGNKDVTLGLPCTRFWMTSNDERGVHLSLDTAAWARS